MRSWTFVAAGLAFALCGLVAPRPVLAQVVVALSGNPAPAGGNYSDFPYSPVLNQSGQVAFVANLTGGSSTQGIIAGAPGSLRTVALQGTAAPAGGNYNGPPQGDPNTFGQPVMNASGQVAFHAYLNGGSGYTPEGIFVGAPGSVQAAALAGNYAPTIYGGYYGTTYVGVNTFGSVSLNDSGQVAFVALLYESGASAGVFVGAPGSVQAAAVTSIHDLNARLRGPYSVNGSGQVSFAAYTTLGPPSESVFVGRTGSIQATATVGSAAPAGGSYSSLLFSGPTLNGAGQVAFVAGLTGGSSTQGIFAGTPGSLQTVALQGTAAPAGGIYNNANGPGFSPFGGIALNGSGQVAFYGTLTGGSSTCGIFVGAPGAIQAVALQGSAAPCGGQFGNAGDLIPFGGYETQWGRAGGFHSRRAFD